MSDLLISILITAGAGVFCAMSIAANYKPDTQKTEDVVTICYNSFLPQRGDSFTASIVGQNIRDISVKATYEKEDCTLGQIDLAFDIQQECGFVCLTIKAKDLPARMILSPTVEYTVTKDIGVETDRLIGARLDEFEGRDDGNSH